MAQDVDIDISMDDSIASSIVSRRGDRKHHYVDSIKIFGTIRMKFDVSMSLAIPNNYPPSKFLIKSFHGLKLTNPNNFTQNGSGSSARYRA